MVLYFLVQMIFKKITGLIGVGEWGGMGISLQILYVLSYRSIPIEQFNICTVKFSCTHFYVFYSTESFHATCQFGPYT